MITMHQRYGEDLLMHEEKQELEKWCLNLIDNFRKSYENIDELEQNQIYINYSVHLKSKFSGFQNPWSISFLFSYMIMIELIKKL